MSDTLLIWSGKLMGACQRTVRTFQQAFDLHYLVRIIQLAEVLCFLGEILSLNKSISLVGNQFRRGAV